MFMPRSVLAFELDFRNWQIDPNRPRGAFVGSPPRSICAAKMLNRRCRRWVISGHSRRFAALSVLPPKVDINSRIVDVRFVPEADIVGTDELTCVIAFSHPKCDFADEPLSAPVKPGFTL